MPHHLSLKVAEAILDDRRGSDYYHDPGILAQFLQGQFGASAESAMRAARSIGEDRIGANYYADKDILADFLDGTFRDLWE